MQRRRAGRGRGGGRSRAVSSSHASCPMAQSDTGPASCPMAQSDTGPVPPPDMCPANPAPPHGTSSGDPAPPRGAISADPASPRGANRRRDATGRKVAHKFRTVGKKNWIDKLSDGSFRGPMSLHPPPGLLGTFRQLRLPDECEDEEMEHLSEPASAQAPQQPDVESLATTLDESSIQVSQPWSKMIPTYPRSFLEKYGASYGKKCKEQQPVQGTASAWQFLMGLKCLYPGLSAHDADIINGAAVQKVAVTSSSEESSMTAASLSSSQGTIEVSAASGRCLFSSSIRLREERDWGLTFYIRIDLMGSYHTYPCVGGPFQSLQETNDAIGRYLKDHRDPTVCLEPDEIPDLVGKAHVDYVVRRCIFWPDGTRKRRLISEPIDERRCRMHQLVKALVDKYNEDYNLVKGAAYEYKAIVFSKIFWQGNDTHYHINFTAKTKEAHDSDPGHLFFAEVAHIPGEHDNMVVTCISIINPSDEGRCYGCHIGMKHPSTAAYFGGHLDVLYGPCSAFAGPCNEWKGTDDDAKAEEAYLRHLFRPADPSFTE